MRAAIYGRVSSERQEKEHTIGSQLEALRAYAAKNGLEIVDCIQAQPGQAPDSARLAKLETKCKKKGVDVITFEPQGSQSEPAMLQSQLRRRGVNVIILGPMAHRDEAASFVAWLVSAPPRAQQGVDIWMLATG